MRLYYLSKRRRRWVRDQRRLVFALTVCLLSPTTILAAVRPDYLPEPSSTKGDPEQVQRLLHSYKGAMAANPNGPGIHMQFGLSMWRLGDIVESKKAFDRELAQRPSNLRARAMVGIIEVQQRRYAEAAEILQKLIEQDPSLIQVWHPLGRALMELGRFDEAKRCLEYAATAKPGVPQIYALLAKVDRRLSDGSAAGQASNLYTAALNLEKSRELAGAGKWDEALLAISQYLETFPKSSDGLYAKAAILFNGFHKLEPAIESARASISSSPDNLEARRFLAVLVLAKGDATEFEHQLRDLLDSDPLDAQAHYFLGRYESDKGLLTDARSNLELAHTLRPDDPSIGVALATFYERAEMDVQADAQYRKLIDAASGRSREAAIYTHYAAFLLNRGRIPEALTQLKQALSLRAVPPEAWYLAGMAHLRQGDLAQAHECLATAIERRPGYAEAQAALNAMPENGH